MKGQRKANNDQQRPMTANKMGSRRIGPMTANKGYQWPTMANKSSMKAHRVGLGTRRCVSRLRYVFFYPFFNTLTSYLQEHMITFQHPRSRNAHTSNRTCVSFICIFIFIFLAIETRVQLLVHVFLMFYFDCG